jgi:hypothetical protein
MALQDVKDDYVKERIMLETWRNRMDISTPVTDVPPESSMSFSYRQGWKIYLTQVLSISERMVNMCTDAENNGGDTTALKDTLQDEAAKYNELAAEAGNKGLTELQKMLAWEATSRLDVAGSLGPSTSMSSSGPTPPSGLAAKKKGAKKKVVKKKTAKK